MPSTSEIQALALKLPLRSRLKLAGGLLRSVGPAVNANERLEEAANRDEELESGEVTALGEAGFWSGIRSRRTA